MSIAKNSPKSIVSFSIAKAIAVPRNTGTNEAVKVCGRVKCHQTLKPLSASMTLVIRSFSPSNVVDSSYFKRRLRKWVGSQLITYCLMKKSDTIEHAFMN